MLTGLFVHQFSHNLVIQLLAISFMHSQSVHRPCLSQKLIVPVRLISSMYWVYILCKQCPTIPCRSLLIRPRRLNNQLSRHTSDQVPHICPHHSVNADTDTLLASGQLHWLWPETSMPFCLWIPKDNYEGLNITQNKHNRLVRYAKYASIQGY